MAKNTAKSWPFKVVNNALTLPKQLQNNFEKVQKTIFLTPKMVKSRFSTWQKVSIFRPIFDLRALKLSHRCQKNFEKVQKTIFFEPENGQNVPSERLKWAIF